MLWYLVFLTSINSLSSITSIMLPRLLLALREANAYTSDCPSSATEDMELDNIVFVHSTTEGSAVDEDEGRSGVRTAERLLSDSKPQV